VSRLSLAMMLLSVVGSTHITDLPFDLIDLLHFCNNFVVNLPQQNGLDLCSESMKLVIVLNQLAEFDKINLLIVRSTAIEGSLVSELDDFLMRKLNVTVHQHSVGRLKQCLLLRKVGSDHLELCVHISDLLPHRPDNLK